MIEAEKRDLARKHRCGSCLPWAVGRTPRCVPLSESQCCCLLSGGEVPASRAAVIGGRAHRRQILPLWAKYKILLTTFNRGRPNEHFTSAGPMAAHSVSSFKT